MRKLLGKLADKLVPLEYRHAARRRHLRKIALRERALHPGRTEASKVILVPPSPWARNIGDTAMLRGLTTELNNVGISSVYLAPHRDPELWEQLVGLPVFERAPRALPDYRAWVPRLKEIRAAYLIGADVLDGKYSPALTLARLEFVDFLATFGIAVVITGCSIREDTPPLIIAALEAMDDNVRLCARDPDSEQRLKKWMKREIPRVTDLAFMLPPKLADNPLLDAVRAMKSRAGGFMLAVAPNRLSVRMGNLDDAERSARMIEYCVNLLERVGTDHPSASFLLIPHDLRWVWSDTRLCDEVVERLSAGLRERVMISSTEQPDEIKGALSEVEVLVTGRMHCGIGGLGVGTPTIFLDYQDKVTGMLKLFDLDTRIEFIEAPERIAEKTADKIYSLLGEGVALRERIRAALPGIRAQSSLNVLENVNPPAQGDGA